MASSSGSEAFDKFRLTLIAQPALRSEMEAALDLNVRRVNPTDRANRFGSGAAVEWILAAVSYAAGIVTVPGGHNENGFDLRDLLGNVKSGLWSVKNTTKRSDFRLTNGIGGAGKGFVEPTVFLSPALPGIVFADPEIHLELASKPVQKSDAVVLAFRHVLQHAEDHPECVAQCVMPANPGTGTDDPWQDYVESLLSPDRFPRLSTMFIESKPVRGTLSSEIVRLAGLRDAGTITEAQFVGLIANLT